MNSLALKVQQGLGRDPHGGEIFCFRGRKAATVKLLWHDGVGMSLYIKRLEAGKFVWPSSATGEAVAVSAAQLGYLLDASETVAKRCFSPVERNKSKKARQGERIGAIRAGRRGPERSADPAERLVSTGFDWVAW